MDSFILKLDMNGEIKTLIEKGKELYESIKEGNKNQVQTIIDCNKYLNMLDIISVIGDRSLRKEKHSRFFYLKMQIAKFIFANYANIEAEEFEIRNDILELLQSHGFNTKVRCFLDTIEILLNREGNIDSRISIKLPLLKLAFENKNDKLVDFLLQLDIAVYFKDGEEETPLHYVVNVGDIVAIKKLIEKGVNLNVTNTFGLTSLHIAVIEDSVEIVRLLIENGANINCRTLEKKVPLHLAAANKSVKMVKVLLENGANVNDSSEGKITPLHTAVETGKKETVILLVENNANVNATGMKDETPLNIAVANEHEEITEFLILKGAVVNHGLNEDMILHMAVFNKNENLVKLLLNNNADVTVKCKGTTALHLAATCRCSRITELLLKKGAVIDEQNVNGDTALHLAVENEDEKTSEILLKYKPNINIKNNMGKTPLYVAVEKGFLNLAIELLYCKPNPQVNKSALHFAVKGKEPNHKKIIVFLKAHGYSTNFIETYKYEETYDFIENCVSNGHVELVDHLLKLGLDPNIAPPLIDFNENFRTLLHAAVENNQAQIAQLLVDNDCEVNIRDKQGKTPIYYAIKWGSKEMTKLLLDNNAKIDDDHELFFLVMARGNHGIIEEFLKRYDDVNVEDELGTTGLHFAAWNGDEESVQLLFKKGARCKALDHLAQVRLTSDMNRSISDLYGEYALDDFRKNVVTTPLHIAARKNHSDIVEALLERGGEVDCRDGCGRTTLHIAAFFSNTGVIDVLMEFDPDLGAVDEYGNTCLDYAFNSQNFSSTMFLDKAFLFIYDVAYEIVPVSHSLDTCKLLTAHVAKYNSIKQKTDQPFLPCYGMSDYDSCVKEIERLKETIVHGNVTFYDVLVQDVNALAIYLKNEQFLESFTLQALQTLNEQFVMYSRLLHKRIRRAKERRILLNEAEIYFTNVLRLPHLVSEKLMSYLHNGDLRCIRQTYELFYIRLGVKCKAT